MTGCDRDRRLAAVRRRSRSDTSPARNSARYEQLVEEVELDVLADVDDGVGRGTIRGVGSSLN
jgi:hypothetical protein